MRNVMTIKYNGSKSYRGTPLYQYDYGQRILFEGFSLPDTYEVHFSNAQRNGFTVTMLGDKDGVMIPDACLLSGKEIYVWLYLHETRDDGETVYTIQIPVTSRPYVSNTEPTPVQQNIITQAIAALNGAVDSATQAKDDAVAASQTAVDAMEQVSADREAAEQAAAQAATAAEDLIQAVMEQGITFDEGTLEDIPEESDSGGGA